MRQRSGGQVVVDHLRANGIDAAFCVPGESFLAILDALHDGPTRLITCRHEAAAANMAVAYGTLTGRPGVCLVTRGPGATQASVGVHTAARLLLTAGDNPTRLRSEAAFAALCGASPVEASSGKTVRHRLNRGGDRAANNALWTIAFVRLVHDPRTRAYAAKRTAQGSSRKEVLRCLKRTIARELYPLILEALTAPEPA